MSDELVRFLDARFDEDERIARAVEDRSAPWDGQWMADGNSAVRTFNGHVLFYRHGPDPLKPGLTDHVAEWDPARVLREIEAKRRLLAGILAETHATLRPGGSTAIYCGVDSGLGEPCECGRDVRVSEYVRLLAQLYADHPDYRAEWRAGEDPS